MILNKIEYSIQDFVKKDGIIRFFLFLAIFFNIFNWGLIYYRFTRFLYGSESVIVLHYNIYFGIDQLGPWTEIYYLPVIGLVILIINFFLSYLLYFQDKMVSYFLLAIVVFGQIFLNTATFFIILMNQY